MANKAPRPGVTGAVQDAYDAVKSYIGATRREMQANASPTGNQAEDSQLRDLSYNTGTEGSTPNRTAQSTDHMNQY